MTEMVERVARAIYEGRNGAGAKAWASQPKSHRAPYLLDARAAIEAMREPTEAMTVAGTATGIDVDRFCPIEYDPDKIWDAMISAALQPPEAGKP